MLRDIHVSWHHLHVFAFLFYMYVWRADAESTFTLTIVWCSHYKCNLDWPQIILKSLWKRCIIDHRMNQTCLSGCLYTTRSPDHGGVFFEKKKEKQTFVNHFREIHLFAFQCVFVHQGFGNKAFSLISLIQMLKTGGKATVSKVKSTSWASRWLGWCMYFSNQQTLELSGRSRPGWEHLPHPLLRVLNKKDDCFKRALDGL